jgi:cytochrome c nitrite reductase small subunit
MVPVVAGSVGILIGLGLYTFVYARGAAYLGNDPAACVNCHVMREQYDGWVKSSHRNVAKCNDCHTPHALVPKYLTKAANGWHHSVAFTSGRFPDHIQIRDRNLAVTEKACRHCHADVVHQIDTRPQGADAVRCTRCHESVGHLR